MLEETDDPAVFYLFGLKPAVRVHSRQRTGLYGKE
jgi:hypothetical protein